MTLYNWQHCHSLLLTLDSRWYTPWVSSLQLLPPFFPIRMDENYNLLPHGKMPWKDAIFQTFKRTEGCFIAFSSFQTVHKGSSWQLSPVTGRSKKTLG